MFIFVFSMQSTLFFDPARTADSLRVDDDASQLDKHFRVGIVVASQKADNTTWVDKAFPEWERHIFVTDDLTAATQVPANKGREGMVYLTFVFRALQLLQRLIIRVYAGT